MVARVCLHGINIRRRSLGYVLSHTTRTVSELERPPQLCPQVLSLRIQEVLLFHRARNEGREKALLQPLLRYVQSQFRTDEQN